MRDYMKVLADCGIRDKAWVDPHPDVDEKKPRALNAVQQGVVESEARHVMMRAGRRTGKSFAGACRAFTHKVADVGTRTWIVGDTYDLAEKEFRYVVELTIAFCQKKKLKPPLVRSNVGSGDLWMRTSWGSEVLGKSAKEYRHLVGDELDCLIMSESPLLPEEAWTSSLSPTLATRHGISIWPYTPGDAGYWLYAMEERVKPLPEWEVFTMAAWDCPHYNQAHLVEERKRLSDDAYYEQYGGEWRFYSGRVYKMVNKRTHEVEPFDIPLGWRIYSGTDFGYRDPTASLYLAKAPTGEAYFVDEYYRSGEATEDRIRHILALERERHYRMTARVADHHGLGNQFIADHRRKGLHTVKCVSEDRRTRREIMQSAYTLKVRPHPYHVREFDWSTFAKTETGMYPDVFIFKDRCPMLWQEYAFFRYKQSARLEGAMGDTEGEDHAIDASEYVGEYCHLGVAVRQRAERVRGAGGWRSAQGLSAATTAGWTGYEAR